MDRQTPMHVAPVRPNAGKATGVIHAIQPHPQRAQDMIISFLVQSAEDIAGMPNFVATETGHAIQVTVRRGRDLGMRAGSRMRLTVRYQGDERGGGFYANAADCQLID